MSSSLCGLGQRTPGPVMSVLRFFEAGSSRPHRRTSSVRPASARHWCAPNASTPAPPAWTRPPIWRWSPRAAMPRAWPFIANAIRSRSFAAAPARRFAKPNAAARELDEPIAIRLTKRFMAEHEAARRGRPNRSARPSNAAPPPEKGRRHRLRSGGPHRRPAPGATGLRGHRF